VGSENGVPIQETRICQSKILKHIINRETNIVGRYNMTNEQQKIMIKGRSAAGK